MDTKTYILKIYNELFYPVVVEKDFTDYYINYFQNHLKIENLTLDDIIEHTAFFWKHRDAICKNMARNKSILKRYWIE